MRINKEKVFGSRSSSKQTYTARFQAIFPGGRVG